MKISAPITALLLSVGTLVAGPTQAGIALFDWATNIDGGIDQSLPTPGVTTPGGFDFSTGLGTIRVTLSGSGSHFVGLFVDHEIDQAINTFFNEYGDDSGAPGATLSWEIDEPEYFFGDIWTNFTDSDDVAGSQLDNSNGVPVGSEDDVSMALGWDFSLGAGEFAEIDFRLSETAPTGGFYLSHTDPDSQQSLYFFSSFRRDSGQTGGVPEPATLLLLGVGLAGVGAVRRHKVART